MKQNARSVSNTSFNKTVLEVLDCPPDRRRFLQTSIAALFAVPMLGVSTLGRAQQAGLGARALGGIGSGALGFLPIAVSTSDEIAVPAGYRTSVLYRWGDEAGIAGASAPWRPDASNSAADQAIQAGMHHDGIQFFPLPLGSSNSDRGLLAINHEYSDDGLLHVGGMADWSADKVRKAQMAHGVSIVEVTRRGEDWQVVRPSQHARRVTGRDPITLSGPAAGHALLRTAADPAGTEALGTLNNCAMGYTPWGTYLTCEENFNGYFHHGGSPSPHEARYGLRKDGFGYRWHEYDERFDAAKHPNEANRFGWVVEIDPYDPRSKPVKRTALGRFKHEGAWTTLTADGRVVVYMGDDERFEYVYKFVSRRAYDPKNRTANLNLLDEGTLYVARFDAGGHGRWIALVHGTGGLDAAAGFADQGEVLIKARQAADRLGATKMDRPEWIAVHPVTQDVYLALTNNDQRGTGDRPGGDEANPRTRNGYGHVLRWREQGADPAAVQFRWSISLLAGDPTQNDLAKKGTAGVAFGSPDGLWFDGRGLLWIQTDVSTSVLNRGDYAATGNNQMLAMDIHSGEVRRFLVGPNACEITGVTETPDGRTFFINIQHPGETASERSDPGNPRAVSNWPDRAANGRPRSSTIVIRRVDGGVIGA